MGWDNVTGSYFLAAKLCKVLVIINKNWQNNYIKEKGKESLDN